MIESHQVRRDGSVPAGANQPGCGSYALLIFAGGWVLLVTVLTQVPTWVIDNVRLEAADGLAGWIWVAVTWGQTFLMALVIVPLAFATREPRLRATYQTWALAVAATALLALSRLPGVGQTDRAVAAQIVLSLAGATLVGVLGRVFGRRATPGAALLPPALAIAGLVSVPSLVWGALGSPLDAILQLAAGLSFGLLTGLLLAGWLFGPMWTPRRTDAGNSQAREDGPPGRANGVLATFGAGTALFILAGAFGFRGSQFLMMIALPPLAISLAGLAALHQMRTRSAKIDAQPPATPTLAAGNGERLPGVYRAGAWLPAAGLVGVTAAVLTMFWDPIELSLVLGPGDILGWALRAAEVTLALAAVAGVLVWAVTARVARRLPPAAAAQAAPGKPVAAERRPRAVWAWTFAAILVWVGAAAVYFRAGNPGFYGEQFFVILRDQADLRPAYDIAARDDRLRYVYKSLTSHADQTQAGLRRALDSRGIRYQPYYLVNGLQVDGGPLLRAYLARQPEVDRIVDSARLRPLPVLPAPMEGSTRLPEDAGWNVKDIGADRVWRELGVTGRGIVVGQSDSGVQGDHPALRDTYRGRNGQNDYNWLDPWYGTRSPVDVGGHGTHTLGTVLGRGGIGVAPDAEWVACVNLARNLGNPGWYLNCLQFMLAPYPQGGNPFRDGDSSRAAHVLNNSWGCPPIEGCDANTLAAATGALRAAGIFVVASAGNGGPDCGTVSDPIALYPDVLSVGAIDRSGNVADFSSRGPATADGSAHTKPDIAAPGVDVPSALPGNTYGSESGTSMAGPHLAGVAALMWSAQPKLIGDIDRTTQILIQTARPYTGTLDSCAGGKQPNNDAGYGVVDAYAAVKAAQAIK